MIRWCRLSKPPICCRLSSSDLCQTLRSVFPCIAVFNALFRKPLNGAIPIPTAVVLNWRFDGTLCVPVQCIAVIANSESLGLPSFVTKYNGKPVLINRSGHCESKRLCVLGVLQLYVDFSYHVMLRLRVFRGVELRVQCRKVRRTKAALSPSYSFGHGSM